MTVIVLHTDRMVWAALYGTHTIRNCKRRLHWVAEDFIEYLLNLPSPPVLAKLPSTLAVYKRFIYQPDCRLICYHPPRHLKRNTYMHVCVRHIYYTPLPELQGSPQHVHFVNNQLMLWLRYITNSLFLLHRWSQGGRMNHRITWADLIKLAVVWSATEYVYILCFMPVHICACRSTYCTPHVLSTIVCKSIIKQYANFTSTLPQALSAECFVSVQ